MACPPFLGGLTILERDGAPIRLNSNDQSNDQGKKQPEPHCDGENPVGREIAQSQNVQKS
jgi:hypothetical protein